MISYIQPGFIHFSFLFVVVFKSYVFNFTEYLSNSSCVRRRIYRDLIVYSNTIYVYVFKERRSEEVLSVKQPSTKYDKPLVMRMTLQNGDIYIYTDVKIQRKPLNLNLT